MQLGNISNEQAIAIDRGFEKMVGERFASGMYIDIFELKKNQMMVIYEKEVNSKFEDLPIFQAVKVTKVDHMRESVRVSNGEYTWNIGSPQGVLINKKGEAIDTPRWDF